VAYHLWVLVFPIVWATLQKQQQINLAKPIISLLSKEYHQRQAMARPNVVQVRALAAYHAYRLQTLHSVSPWNAIGCSRSARFFSFAAHT
jgi:hypothetical protein